MTDERPNSQTYILRMWAVTSTDSKSLQWHASLDEPRTGKRVGFANLEQLFVHLMEITKHGPPPVEPESTEKS